VPFEKHRKGRKAVSPSKNISNAANVGGVSGTMVCIFSVCCGACVLPLGLGRAKPNPTGHDLC